MESLPFTIGRVRKQVINIHVAHSPSPNDLAQAMVYVVGMYSNLFHRSKQRL